MKSFRKKRIFRRIDNRGSSLVLVIISFVFVAALCIISMSLAIMNIQMKNHNLKSKANFYSAETVLEQIQAGIQQDVSSAMTKAYSDVMQKYLLNDETSRNTYFKNAYLSNLVNSFKQPTTNEKFRLDKLAGYVQADVMSKTALTSSDCVMQALSNGVVLKNINVKYTDAQGYVSVIQTDIKINVPDLSFTQTSSMPKLFEFSLVANDSIYGNNTGNVNIWGSVYGGQNGISINGNSVWNISNATRVVTDKALTVGANSAMTVNPGVALWANDVNVNSGTVNLLGKTYVNNDLSVSGQSSGVTLKNEYYGYGGDFSDSSKSSAIIMNGTQCTIDLSGLNKLLISGNAFVGTKALNQNNSVDIVTGESLANKANQLAYLIPTECVSNGKNPMTGADYDAIADKSTLVNFSTPAGKLNGKPLSSYSSQYKAIFRQNSGGTMVYLYLSMDEGTATKYFSDYYNINKSDINSYLNIYKNNIKINNNMARVTVNGGMTAYSGTVSSFISSSKPTGASADELSMEQGSYSDIFYSLTKKLTSFRYELTADECNGNVFTNLIDVTALQNFIKEKDLQSGGADNLVTVSSDGLDAVLVNGDYTYDNTKSDGVCLIIATGNVTVKKNFSGLIVANGKVTVGENSGITIKGNEENMSKILQATLSGDTRKVISFFKNGSNYVINGTNITAGASDIAGNVKISSLITYENWSKQ